MTARDWDKLAHEPEFQALLSARRRFAIPATLLCLIAYLALPIAIVLAPDYMKAAAFGPLTRAVLFSLAVVAFSLILLALYLRVADKFDERAEAIAQNAHQEFAQ